MFGGVDVLIHGLADCIADGASRSTDPHTDAVALWLGLHGLAHQRAVAPGFPWPEAIESRVIHLLAGLDSDSLRRSD